MKNGWQTAALSEVSAISYGYTESANSEPIGPRFLRITDIQSDHVDWDRVPYCKIEASDIPRYRLASGDSYSRGQAQRLVRASLYITRQMLSLLLT